MRNAVCEKAATTLGLASDRTRSPAVCSVATCGWVARAGTGTPQPILHRLSALCPAELGDSRAEPSRAAVLPFSPAPAGRESRH